MPPDNNKKQVVQYGLVVLIVISIGVLGLREFFIVMPKMYRPNLEQVINWFGLHNSPEVDFILINSENIDQEWRPYLFRELLTEHKFTLITENEFWESESDLGVGSAIAIFFEPGIAGQITQRLVRIIPNAKEISFQNRDQKLIGKAIIQGDIVIPHQASFLEGVIEIFTSPIIWVLIPLLLFVCIYWIKQQQNRSIFLEFGIYYCISSCSAWFSFRFLSFEFRI